MPRLTLIEQGGKPLAHLSFTHRYPQYIWRHDYKVSAATEKDLSILANYETSCTLKRMCKWLKFYTQTRWAELFGYMILHSVYKQVSEVRYQQRERC